MSKTVKETNFLQNSFVLYIEIDVGICYSNKANEIDSYQWLFSNLLPVL